MKRAVVWTLFLMARRKKPPALAGTDQEVFVLAMVTADPGQVPGQVAAVDELMDDLRDNGPQEAAEGPVCPDIQ